MKHNSKTSRITSALLAILMIVTMVPTFMLSSFAEGTSKASLPAEVSGEWEHMTVNDGSEHNGKGEYYISMWFKNTSFILMQTSDNQSFELNYEFWAMKNDGINTCQINNIVFSNPDDLNLTETVWKEISTCYGIDDPTAYTLPGTFGSGYSNQLAKNIAKWNGSADVTANGSAKYTVPVNITYHSGATGMAPKTHSTDSDNESIMLDITVVDLRELLNTIDTAKNLASSDKLNEEQKNAVLKVVEEIESGYILDGSAAYTQETIDSLTDSLKGVTYADFTEYNKALEKAEIVLGSPYYTDEAKETIRAAIADKDVILYLKVNEQSIVDEATQKILDALASITRVLPPANSIDNSNPSESGSFVINSVANPSKDGINITLSKKEIYLDITERLEDVGLKYNYSCEFGKSGWYTYKQYYAGPLSADCTGSEKKQIASANSPANYDTYFNSYGVLDANITKTLAERGELSKNSALSLEYNFDGAPLQTTGDGAKVYIGFYGEYTDTPWLSGTTTYKTSEVGHYTIATEIPNFMLYVYDKAPLKAALENAYGVFSDATNYNDFLALISEAERIYGTRAVTDTEVRNITDAINNFEFTYSIDASASDPATGSVEIEVTEGKNTTGNEYTGGSVLKLSAVPAADYEFNGWADKNDDVIRTITVDGNRSFVANFKFVLADYSELQNAIANVPSDTSVYSEETVAALNEALKNANSVINAGYGKSNQGLVDEATKQLNDAVKGLVKVVFNPCDYTYIDIAIDYSENITNDGRYKDNAWTEFVNALTAAKAVDRNLTDENEANQKIIDDATERLAKAVDALEDSENQNGLCDYSNLDAAKDKANDISDINDGRFTEDAWNKYKDALEAANSVKDGMYNDDGGVNQKAIDDAASALDKALTELENTRNYVVEIKNENGVTTDTVFVARNSDTTIGNIKDRLTLPEDTTGKKYIGWEDENENLVTDDTPINGDKVLSPSYDLTAITPGNDSQIKVDTDYTFMVGITVGKNTVAELKAQLQNDGRTIIVIKDGEVLSDDALVGTGCIIKCVSKADHNVVYEEATVILYGDVNGDGLVDIEDKILLERKGYMLDDSAINDNSVYMTAADLNHDGVIDGFDVSLLDLQLSGVKIFDQTVEYYK